MKRVISILLFLLCCFAHAEIIDPTRRVDWQGNVGVLGGIPDSSAMVVFTNMSSSATAAQIQSALQACPSNQVVKLAAATYNLTGDIDWFSVGQGVVLKGAGTNTILNLQTGIIYMRGGFSETALQTSVNLASDSTKGGFTAVVTSTPSWLRAGHVYLLDQLDDNTFVQGGGTEGGAGYRATLGQGQRGLAQVVRCTNVTGTTASFEIPMYYGWATAKTAQLTKGGYDPDGANRRIRCGIEDMRIVSSFSDTGQGTIKMEVCDNCWIKNVELDNTPGLIHVMMNFCYRCEVRHSYIHHSHNYGGGQGYGVSLFNVTSATLVEDNIFNHLHIAMGMAFGSSGNVFAYNYEQDGTADSTQSPGMSTHGVHCAFNLFEGNWCADKLLADWTHGSSSHNTLFRSVVTGTNGTGDRRACVSIEYSNRYWNVVGNLIGTTGLHNKYVEDSSSTSQGSQGSLFKIGGEVNINDDFNPNDANSYTAGSFFLNHANWNSVSNAVLYDGNVADHTLTNSYYRLSAPSMFTNTVLQWPPFNPANATAAGLSPTNIPAGYRFIFGVDPPAGSGGGGGGSPTNGVSAAGFGRADSFGKGGTP